MRRPRKLRWEGVVYLSAILCTLIPMAAAPYVSILQIIVGNAQAKRDYTVEGPACPVVEKPSPISIGKRPPISFDYHGVSYTRSFGHVECQTVPDGPIWAPSSKSFQVCQFTGPSMVAVTHAGRTTIFEPPPVRTTTVTVRDGKVSCVVGGWFRLG